MFEIPGWDEFVARCEGVVDKWEDKKNSSYRGWLIFVLRK